MPFVQSAPGGRLTDWRSSCQVNSDAKRDHQTTTEGEYRMFLQKNAVQARDTQRSHLVFQPYFDIKGCVRTSNPKVEEWGRPQ